MTTIIRASFAQQDTLRTKQINWIVPYVREARSPWNQEEGSAFGATLASSELLQASLVKAAKPGSTKTTGKHRRAKSVLLTRTARLSVRRVWRSASLAR
jgi:hypothetical protein